MVTIINKKLRGIVYNLFLATLFSLLFVGCGGGISSSQSSSSQSSSPSSSSPQSVTVTGKAIDGYIKGAKACLDINDNQQCDNSEPSAITQTGGNFTIKTSQGTNYPIVVEVNTTAIDESTNKNFTNSFKLFAPKRGTTKNIVVTSLTTMVKQELIDDNTSNLSTAQDNVASITGVSKTNLYVDYIANNDVNISSKAATHVEYLQNTNNVSMLINDLQNNNAPTLTSSKSVSVPENQTEAITLSASDADNNPLTYSLSGTDASSFNINTSTGVVTFKTAPDFEIKTSYTFTGIVSDGLTTDSKNITIKIQNLNDNPPILTSNTSASVKENQTSAIRLSASDADNNPLTYSLRGTDAGQFTINATTGVITFRTAPDFETKTSYTFTAIVSDDTFNDTKNITISIQNLNDNRPILAQNTSVRINENQTSAIRLSASDADNNLLTYSLSGTDASDFIVGGTTGIVRFKTAPNYEANKSYTFTGIVSDGLYTDSKDINISILNLNDNAPVFTSSTHVSVPEKQTAVMTLTATDEDNDTLQYQLSGTDANKFTLNSTTGVVKFTQAPIYKAKANYTFTATASDGLHTDATNIAIDILNPDVHTVTLQTITDKTIAEDTNITIDLNATDTGKNTISYTADSNDTSIATVSIVDGKVVVTPVANANGIITVEVNATARGLSSIKTFQLNVAAVDDPPYFTSNQSGNYSVDENSSAQSVLLAASDTESNPFTFHASASNSKVTLSLVDNNLTITPVTNATGSVAIDVKVIQDSNTSLYDEYSYTVTINPPNANHAPTIKTNFANIALNKNSGTTNYEINVSDIDGDALTLAVESNNTSIITVTPNWSGSILQANYQSPLDFNLSTVTNATGIAKILVTVSDTDKNATTSFDVNVTAVAASSTIKATGQTTSSVDYDDGYYKKGATVSYTRDSGSSTVTDNVTHLMWEDDILGVDKTWSDAETYCNNLSLGGFKNWRLPTRQELVGLSDYGRFDPAMDPTFQNNPSSFFWSSTPYVSNMEHAWIVYSYNGSQYDDNKTRSYYVRCVR